MSVKKSVGVDKKGLDNSDLSFSESLRPQRLGVSSFGMVSSAHFQATRAGVEILEQGGTAIDAAVATAFALGVCEPQASGLGGQSMLLFYNATTRKTIALDGSSRCPSRATVEALAGGKYLQGHTATTVPSTPATLGYTLSTYGSLPISVVLEPAIRLAERGFEITELQHALVKRQRKALIEYGGAKFFLIEGKRTPKPGYLFKQPVLAETLRCLAKKGIEDFYTGKIARAIHADMVKHKGFIRKDDLAHIPWPIERKPIGVQFGEHRVKTFPPPAAGRVLVRMLNSLEHFWDDTFDPDSPRGALIMAEIIRRAFIARQDVPFDPNFYSQVKDKRMLSKKYSEKVAEKIRKKIKSSGETTHLSVMDRFGNVVGLTQSIERIFGSCAASPDLGFLYNNYLMAYEHEDITHPYYLRPNGVPWASVAPTIVFQNRTPVAVIGSPGSERIAPAIMQVFVRLWKGDSPFRAVDAPRIFCDSEGRVHLEASRMDDGVIQEFQKHGYEVVEREAYSFFLGCIALVLKEGKRFTGVADPRRDGEARGPRK